MGAFFLECLRLLATLRLDPVRSKLIGGFIESYLRLSAQGMKQYERELAQFAPEERKATMAITTYWEQRGIDQGKSELIALLVQDRFGTVPAETEARLNRLSSAQFNDMGRALLHFDTLADLDRWLSQNAS